VSAVADVRGLAARHVRIEFREDTTRRCSIGRCVAQRCDVVELTPRVDPACPRSLARCSR
jgi:hypothetical protein